MEQFIVLKRRRILVLLKNRRLFWHFWHKSIGSVDRRWKSIADTASVTFFCKSIGNTDTDTAKVSAIEYRCCQWYWY